MFNSKLLATTTAAVMGTLALSGCGVISFSGQGNANQVNQIEDTIANESNENSNVNGNETGNLVVEDIAPSNTYDTLASSSQPKERYHYPEVEISPDIAAGELSVNGAKIVLGQTTLSQFMSEVQGYALFNDPGYDYGNGIKVPPADVPQILSEKYFITSPVPCSLIYDESQSYESMSQTQLTVWHPSDESVPFGDAVIIAVEHASGMFDDLDGVYSCDGDIHLPGGITTETTSYGGASFTDAYGEPNGIPEGSQGFTDGNYTAWNAPGQAILAIRFGSASTSDKALGFKYSLPWHLEDDGWDYDCVVDGLK